MPTCVLNCALIPLPLAKSDLVLVVSVIYSRQVEVVTMFVWTTVAILLKEWTKTAIGLLDVSSHLCCSSPYRLSVYNYS